MSNFITFDKTNLIIYVNHKRRNTLRLLLTSTLILIGLCYYGCRKDNKSASATITAPAILQAKSWYDNTYPVTNNPNSLITQGTNATTAGAFDFIRHIKPDWQHPTSYTRLNDKVIEMPLDSAAKYNFGLKNTATKKLYAGLKYSSSYYLILNDGKGYQAYLMVVIADSAYVKNDLSKLSHNTYRKHDADFSGMVFYFTPKGEYLSGYLYNNGQLVQPSASAGQQSNNNLKTDGVEERCVDTYWEVYNTQTGEIVSLTYMYTTCTTEGGGGGGTSSAPPPGQCPNGPAPTSIGGLKVDNVPANPGTGDGGFPPPTATTTCPIADPAPDTTITDGCNVIKSTAAQSANNIVSGNSSIAVAFQAETQNSSNNVESAAYIDKTSAGYVASTPVASNSGDDYSTTSTDANTVAIAHDHTADHFPTPSPYDIYKTGELAVSTGGRLSTGYIVSAGKKYAIVVDNTSQFKAFIAQYGENALQKDANGNYTGEFDDNTPLGQDVEQVGKQSFNANPISSTNAVAADLSAEETSLVYFVSAYNTGITLMVQDSSGNFQPLHVTATTVNGVTVYNSTPCNN